MNWTCKFAMCRMMLATRRSCCCRCRSSRRASNLLTINQFLISLLRYLNACVILSVMVSKNSFLFLLICTWIYINGTKALLSGNLLQLKLSRYSWITSFKLIRKFLIWRNLRKANWGPFIIYLYVPWWFWLATCDLPLSNSILILIVLILLNRLRNYDIALWLNHFLTCCSLSTSHII